ncbi:MAG: LptA/OstA family protein [Candidatus Omnitrophota bacterium]
MLKFLYIEKGDRLYKSNVTRSILIALCVIMCAGCAVCHAQDEDLTRMQSGQSIVVDGDKVEYFEEDGKITAEGNVSITYGDIKLTCDRIEVNTALRQALCEGARAHRTAGRRA